MIYGLKEIPNTVPHLNKILLPGDASEMEFSNYHVNLPYYIIRIFPII